MAAPMGDDLSRLVGWINRLEWQTVFERLYNDDLQCQKQAVDRIVAWKSRFGDQMPVSIECTASLVRAQIMDKQGDSADAVQLAYSTAVIRFVNLITGREQKGQVSMSVSFLASKVGLPSWMVDLRHEAAHRIMPSLSVLREGASQALSWLCKEYWEAQNKKGHLEEEPEGCANDSDTKELVTACIERYQQEQFHEISFSQGQSSGNICSDKSLADLEELLTTNKNARHIVTSVLLLDGYLVPTEEQLAALHVLKGFKKDANNIPVLDTRFITFWRPLLRLLHTLNITPLLIASLLRELAKFAQPDNQVAEFLQGWAVFIATEAARGPPSISSPGAKRNRNGDATKTLYEGCKTIRLPWNDLVNICLENPNPYTLSALPQMLGHMNPKPTRETINKITRLSSILTMQTKDNGIKDQSQGVQKKGKKSKKKSQDNSNADVSSKADHVEDNVTNNQAETRTQLADDEKSRTVDSKETSMDVDGSQGLPSQDDGEDTSQDDTQEDAGSINSGPTDEAVGVERAPVHSAEDLAAWVRKKRVTSQGGKCLSGVSTESNRDAKWLRKQNQTAWTRCAKGSKIDWSAYPLGVLPGQPNDPDYFVLNIHEGNRKRSLDQASFNQDSDPTNGKAPRFQSDEIVKSNTHRGKAAGHAFETRNQEEDSGGYMSDMLLTQCEREIPKGKSPQIATLMQTGPRVGDTEDISDGSTQRDKGGQLPGGYPTGGSAVILEADLVDRDVEEKNVKDDCVGMGVAEEHAASQNVITLF